MQRMPSIACVVKNSSGSLPGIVVLVRRTLRDLGPPGHLTSGVGLIAVSADGGNRGFRRDHGWLLASALRVLGSRPGSRYGPCRGVAGVRRDSQPVSYDFSLSI